MKQDEYLRKISDFCDWLRAEGTAYYLRDLAGGKHDGYKAINALLRKRADEIDPYLPKEGRQS
jgi:hypothetical protein